MNFIAHGGSQIFCFTFRADDKIQEREGTLFVSDVNLQVSVGIQAEVPLISYVSHNGQPLGRVGQQSEFHAPPDGVLAWEKAPRETLVNEQNRKRRTRIPSIKGTAFEDRNTHGSEIAGCHSPYLRYRCSAGIEWRQPFDGKAIGITIRSQREIVDSPNGIHSGQLADAFQRPLVERGLTGRFGIGKSRELKWHGQHVLCGKSRFYFMKPREAANQ